MAEKAPGNRHHPSASREGAMSDTDNPAGPPPEQPRADQPRPEPPRAEPPRQRRLRPERDKPPRTGDKVPSLEAEQTYGFGQKIDAFDAEMERELQEAMGGMSDTDMYGDEQSRRQARAPGGEGPKKGRVFRIHGQDVFIELPGGRTQGVLPILQFP